MGDHLEAPALSPHILVDQEGGEEARWPGLSLTTADHLSLGGKGMPKTVSEKWGSRISMSGEEDLGLAKDTYARIQGLYCVIKRMKRKGHINTFSSIPAFSSLWARELIHCFNARSYLLAQISLQSRRSAACATGRHPEAVPFSAALDSPCQAQRARTQNSHTDHPDGFTSPFFGLTMML